MTAPSARQVSSGRRPQAAISTSDQGLNRSSCASEPKSTTRLTLKRSSSRRAAWPRQIPSALTAFALTLLFGAVALACRLSVGIHFSGCYWEIGRHGQSR